PQLSVKSGAFHSHEGGGSGNIAAKAVNLRVKVLLFEALTRLTQRKRQKICGPITEHRSLRRDFGRQCLGADDILRSAGSHDEQPIDHVTKLAYIPRPIVALQRSQGIFAQNARGHSGVFGGTFDEVVAKVWNI